ncbi:MAG: hypothetical protein JWR72_1649 [Flavisolibacter sp.]|nr:hypothetical protein [Flavisolibacter sp.]
MGCANIIPPGGGPRDTMAPVLLSVTPKDSTLNFRGNRITFTFDEFIDDPQDIQNNLLFTPTFEINPELAIRAKTMTLRLRDSLLPNTTYTFNFGNAIRDINENNVLRNFVYTFSTGAALDSLTLSGKVLLAQTGKTDSTLIVILHRNLTDSAVIKERPVYVSKVDPGGNFRFQNLPKGTFAVFALGDAGIMRRYQNKSQLFAFSDSTVTSGETKDITLFAYREEVTPNAATSGPAASLPRGTAANDRRLRFTPPAGTLDLQTDYILAFQSPLKNFDSAQVILSTDSSFTPANYRVALDSSGTALRFSSQWKEGTRYNLILNKDFAEDSAGRKLLKTDTLNFTTKKRSDYGQVKIRLRNIDLTKNPVLQFVQADVVTFSGSIKSGTFSASLFNPGEYELRIFYDANNNGKWDAGQFFGKKRQPELVKPIERRITIKAGFENDVDLSL